MLAALPAAADGRLDALPRPAERPAPHVPVLESRQPLRFATRPRSTLEARIADAVTAILAGTASPDSACTPDLDTDFWLLGLTSLGLTQLALRRSEERRVGKECVSTCRSRWSPSH